MGVADEDGKITGKQYCQCSFVNLIIELLFYEIFMRLTYLLPHTDEAAV